MGAGPLRAVAGPDRVSPNRTIVGFDGTRSTAPSGLVAYKWRLIQVPEGDPHLAHYPQPPTFPGTIDVLPETIKVPGAPVEATFTAGSLEVSFASGGLPYNLGAGGPDVKAGDILEVSAGLNAGRYVVTSDPYGFSLDRVELDRVASGGEVTSFFQIYEADSRLVHMSYDPMAVSAGDILIVSGHPTEILFAGPDLKVEDALPFAGMSFDHAMIISSAMVANALTPYASFVPSVQGLHVMRLRVDDAATPGSPESDIAVVSILPSGTSTGLPVDASWIWRSLGNFWDLVADKGWMETSWRAFIRVFGAMLQETWNVRASYSLGTSQDVMMSRWVGCSPALPEPEPDKAVLVRRFPTVYSAELPATGDVSVVLVVHDVPGTTTISVTADTSIVADAVNAALASEGIDGIRARVKRISTVLTRHLAITSESHAFIAEGGLFGGSRESLFTGKGLRIDEHMFWLSSGPHTAGTFYRTNYDSDGILAKGDIINIGGTSYTIATSGTVEVGGSYPFSYVSTVEEIPDVGPTLHFVIPSYIRSAEIDFRDELVVPGDVVIVEVEDGSDGTRWEGSAKVAGAGFYRLGIVDPAFFCRGCVVRLKRVLRLFYVPVDETYLSIPVLKEHSDAGMGWREYEHYVVAERWGRRAIVFDFLSEMPDASYPALLRELTPGPGGATYPVPDRLWAEIVYVDQRPDLSERFGKGLGMPIETAPGRVGFSYQRALLGLWYCRLRGSKPGMIERGISIICGAPFFEADGEIVGVQTLSAGRGYLLARDLLHREIVRGYVYPLSLGLDVNPATGKTYAVGDTVQRFDPVSNAALHRDYISHPEFVKGLIAAGVITEPEKVHNFWLAVDADILDPSDVAAVRAAYEFLLDFRTTYNHPFFALLEQFEDLIDLHDAMSLKVRMHLVSYLGARWGTPMFDRVQLSGRMAPWPGMPLPMLGTPPDSGVHNYFDIVLDGREHYAAVRIDAGPPAVQQYEIRHVQPDGTLGDVVDPERAGIVPGNVFMDGDGVEDAVTVVTATDVTLTSPAALVDPTHIFAIFGAPGWSGFDDMLFYLRDYVHITLTDPNGGGPGVPVIMAELITPPDTPIPPGGPAGYPGPEPTSEVP